MRKLQYKAIGNALLCIVFPFVLSGFIMFLLAKNKNNPFGQWIEFAGNNISNKILFPYYENKLIITLSFIYNSVFPVVFFINGILSGFFFRKNVFLTSLALSMPALFTLCSLFFSKTHLSYILLFALLSGVGSLIPGKYEKWRK